MTFIPNPNLINKQMAERSHSGTSWDPEKRAEQEIRGFAQDVQAVYDTLSPYAKSESQKATLDQEMQEFQKNYAHKYNDKLASHGRIVSSFIAGPSKFPGRRMEKANVAYDKKYQEMIDWKKRAQNAIMKKLKGEAIEEAGGELQVLKNKIEKAEKHQEVMKAVNTIIRKRISDIEKITQISKATGFSEDTARKLATTKDFAGRLGFPSYELTNNNANIKRMKDRLAQLEKRESTPTSELVFEGGTIIDNSQADRIQIFFDNIPSVEIRTKLKGEGWRWSPREGAWQRMRTSASMQSAKRITGAVEKKVDEKVQEIKQELTQGETIDVPAKEIPGLMKKGTLPEPDWEFEKQVAERLKEEAERERDVTIQEAEEKIGLIGYSLK